MSNPGRPSRLRKRTASPTETTFLATRTLPPLSELTAQGRYVVQAGDRPDLVAAKVLGDPLQYWRLCDANSIPDPFDLVRPVGRVLVVPAPAASTDAFHQPKVSGTTARMQSPVSIETDDDEDGGA